MKNKKNITLTSIFLASLTACATLAKAEDIFTVTGGIDYSTGKYGQSQSTDMTYVPFIAKYETNDTSFKLTVPWLKITGPGDVVGGNSPVVLGKSNRPITTQSGLGDIIASASKTIVRTDDENPFILDLTGKVKFGTASSSKYLGTGENDYTVDLEAYKQLKKALTLFGDAGYKVMGDPSGINLNNVWFGSAGLSYRINSTSSAGIMAETRQATYNHSAALRETTLFLTHKFNAEYKLQSYLTHGYSNSSTDWGGGLMIGRIF